jgi:acetyl-CoA carboxylase carboxyltransferase component/biotin carboxyl carrier protein
VEGADGERDAAEILLAGGPVVVKAVAGGGGRGMRVVTDPNDLPAAFAACEAEARAAFGSGALYVERLVTGARHVEVQLVGDGHQVVALGDRDCSLQRRHQKVIEIAPAPGLADDVRGALTAAAVRLADAVGLSGLATVEYLVWDGGYAFVEVNPRLQVEHTVTEAVTSLDLVALQLELARGMPLADALPEVPVARGAAIQLRVNTETVTPDGTVRPGTGVIDALQLPTGPGVRVDTHAYPGFEVSARYDPLLAKIVVHDRSLDAAVALAYRAATETHVGGIPTNLDVLRGAVGLVADGARHTRLLDERLGDILAASHPRRVAPATAPSRRADHVAVDPPPGVEVVTAPVTGTVVALPAAAGDTVADGAEVALLEAMKMQHGVPAPSGTVVQVLVEVGDTVTEGAPIAFVAPGEVGQAAGDGVADRDPTAIRPDLAALRERRHATTDEARPDAVDRRHDSGHRTIRANIADLTGGVGLVEYGALALAAQRSRRSVDELIERTPADGIVTGIAPVNAGRAPTERVDTMVIGYDYTVLAGTQGHHSHRKLDRALQVAADRSLPVVLFAEGGGGRPGDTDLHTLIVGGLDYVSFERFAALSGQVPLVGVVTGPCFAGNAALAGCCDVVIATRDASIGMGGPAMIEGGGLGVHAPEDVGPADALAPNGVIDVVVDGDAAAVDVARRYLGYFQGPVDDWTCADQGLLRGAVPEQRLRTYDVRRVVDLIADDGSVLELRASFGREVATFLARVEGAPIGIVANDPARTGGALTSDASDKAARFLQLCEAFGLPVVFLCDTPGFMVGPDSERTAAVRHMSRMFVTAASLTVPFGTVVVRKAYGLGAMAMAGGGFKAGRFVVAWPTGEFGAMGLEGAVKLGFRRELDAIEDDAERERAYRAMVDAMYAHGQAVNAASLFEIDDAIDPADTRRWITTLTSGHTPRWGGRPFVDTW